MIGTKTPSHLNMTNNHLPIIEKALAPSVRVFFSQRGKIIDNDNYSSFNACHYTGDIPSHIEQNRKALCQHFGISQENLIIPLQTHSSNVSIIDHTPINGDRLTNVDGIVTNVRGVLLAVNTADCLPILLADATAGVIAAVHSGWRGTVNRISVNAINAMKSLGAEARNIKVFIGPSIKSCCFEVGDEVVEQFNRTFPQYNDIIISTTPRPHINLSQACIHSMIEVGIDINNISDSGICSHCNYKDYFSARRVGINSGRTLSGVILEH